MLRGSFLWGLNICVGQENKKGKDQRLDRLYVQDRRGYRPDAGCMTKVWGEREQRVRQGTGMTSGLGGRGDLRRSSLGS